MRTRVAALWIAHRSGRRPAPPDAFGAYVAIALATAIPLLFVLNRYSIDWDARVVWFGHARWFFIGGPFARAALSRGSVWGKLNDYPILIPSTVGSLWRLSSGIDARRAQLAVGLLNGSAIALLGWSLRELYAERFPKAATIAACGLCLAVYGFGGRYSSDGYADVLWSVTIVGAAILLLVAPVTSRRLWIGLLLLGVGGLTKSEGWTAALLVATLCIWRHRDFVRHHRWVLLGLPALCIWPLTSRLAHATTRYSFDQVKLVITGDDSAWHRAVPSLHVIVNQAPVLFVTALVLFLVRVLGRGFVPWLGPPLRFTVMVGGLLVFFLVSYMIDNGGLDILLATSVDRTTISLKLCALVEILIAAFIAAESLATVTRRSTSPRGGER